MKITRDQIIGNIATILDGLANSKSIDLLRNGHFKIDQKFGVSFCEGEFMETPGTIYYFKFTDIEDSHALNRDRIEAAEILEKMSVFGDPSLPPPKEIPIQIYLNAVHEHLIKYFPAYSAMSYSSPKFGNQEQMVTRRDNESAEFLDTSFANFPKVNEVISKEDLSLTSVLEKKSYFAQANEELEQNKTEPGIWAIAYANTENDEAARKKYINLRAEELELRHLQDEARQAEAEKLTLLKIEEEERLAREEQERLVKEEEERLAAEKRFLNWKNRRVDVDKMSIELKQHGVKIGIALFGGWNAKNIDGRTTRLKD